MQGDFQHSLTAVYRVSVLPHIRALLEAGQLRLAFVFDRAPTVKIDVQELRRVDPQLWSLKNCNRPEDYEEALRLAGF